MDKQLIGVLTAVLIFSLVVLSAIELKHLRKPASMPTPHPPVVYSSVYSSFLKPQKPTSVRQSKGKILLEDADFSFLDFKFENPCRRGFEDTVSCKQWKIIHVYYFNNIKLYALGRDKGSPDCKGKVDIRGVPRPQGKGCDIGPYEYNEQLDTYLEQFFK